MGLRDVLEDIGLHVHVAASEREARDALAAASRMDLVILDRWLAEGDSNVLLRTLVDAPAGAKIPVLAMSGREGIASRIEALRDGAADFVAKPYDTRFLSKRVKELAVGPIPFVAPPYRVLVVDDSLTYGHAVAQELGKDGHDIALAATAREAAAYLELQCPDVVLLDVFLPDQDGIELAKWIRSTERAPNVPIVMLTGRESTVVRQRAADANVSEFLAKNTPLSEVRAWVAGARDRVGKPDYTAPVAPKAQPGTSGEALFQRVIVASGLSLVLGRSTLELALRRAGTDPEALTPESLSRSLGQIEKMLVTFLPAHAVRGRLSAITALAREGASTK